MNAMGAQDVLPRRVEVLAGLSVAIDLGLGQPAEHMLRSAVIASRLAHRLGLDRHQQDTVYYTTLVMWIGCHADSAEYAHWFGDDIAVRRDAYLVDWSGLPYLRFVVGNLGRGESLPPRRMRTMAELFRDARGQMSLLVHSHCLSAAALAGHIGLGADVEHAITFTFERFDGGRTTRRGVGCGYPDRDAGGATGRHGGGSPPHVRGGRGRGGDGPESPGGRSFRSRGGRRRVRRRPPRHCSRPTPTIPGSWRFPSHPTRSCASTIRVSTTSYSPSVISST